MRRTLLDEKERTRALLACNTMLTVRHDVRERISVDLHLPLISTLPFSLLHSTTRDPLFKDPSNQRDGEYNSIVSFVVRRIINIPARVREKKRRRRRRRREGRSTEEGLLSPSFLLAFFPLPVSSNSFLRSSRGPDPRRFPVPRCYLAATDTRPLASEFRYVRVPNIVITVC